MKDFIKNRLEVIMTAGKEERELQEKKLQAQAQSILDVKKLRLQTEEKKLQAELQIEENKFQAELQIEEKKLEME